VIATDLVLFDGRIGSQRLYVCVDWQGTSLGLMTHEMGPALENAFGKDEIETWLLVEPSHLHRLTDALRAEATHASADPGPLRLVVDRFGGDPSATTAFRTWLTEHHIPYEFHLV
jgi:hypothetical protein